MEEFPNRPVQHSGVRAPGWDVRIAGGLFLGWIVLARAGPMLELAPGVRAWYPPVALLAAACILWGARALVPIICAASAVLVWLPDTSEPLGRLLVVSAVLKLVYWGAARLLHTRRFDLTFSTPDDVAWFGVVFLAAGAVAALLNTIDARGLASLLEPDAMLRLRGFWIGDVVSIVALTPAMVIIADWLTRASGTSVWSAIRRLRAGWTRNTTLQLASIPLALLISAALTPSVGFFAFALCFLPLGWVALSHGARVAALANVVLAVGAVWLVHGRGVIVPTGLEVQAFVGMLAITGLLVGSVADERERAFALLGESEERYRRLVELLPEPVLVSFQGRVVFANRAAAAVLGAANSSAMVGVPLATLGTPSVRAIMEDRIRLLAEGRPVPMMQQTLNRIDGSGTVELETISVPFTYQGLAAALTVARDVTARVRLEEELRHAQRMEAVGRLAGGVAHDFNNLLTVIISYSELILAETADDTALRRDIGEIRHAADRAAALTSQLLSFSRRQVLQPAPLQVNEVVRNADALLRRVIGPDIDIVARLDPAAGMVLADKGQLEQVIMNLVVNARDAMPNGGTLTLGTALVSAGDAPAAARTASRASRFALIEVRDTGVGMDVETLRRIFDPFFTTKEVGRGTGLGLATVHGIVEQSGGAVAVESTVGAGSVFRILLPSLESASVTPAPAPSDEPERVSPARGQGRVLLVEDDAAVREGVRRMLGALGYDVVEASGAAAALAALASSDQTVHLLLSDIAMPTVDGRQLAREVRSRWPALPIVLMSGYADPDTLERDLPGVVLLQKPLEAGALVAAIEAAVEGR